MGDNRPRKPLTLEQFLFHLKVKVDKNWITGTEYYARDFARTRTRIRLRLEIKYLLIKMARILGWGMGCSFALLN